MQPTNKARLRDCAATAGRSRLPSRRSLPRGPSRRPDRGRIVWVLQATTIHSNAAAIGGTVPRAPASEMTRRALEELATAERANEFPLARRDLAADRDDARAPFDRPA